MHTFHKEKPSYNRGLINTQQLKGSRIINSAQAHINLKNSEKLEGGSPVLPIPDGIDPKTIPAHSNCKVEMITPYKDGSGGIQFYIARIRHADQKKLDIPYCWWRYPDGHQEWKCKQPLENNRILLNLPNILKYPDKPVYAGEGEKVARAIQKLFSDCVATTSSGGARAASKSDWSVLEDRDVVLFPDNDASGYAYRDEIYRLAKLAGARSIGIFCTKVLTEYAVENGTIVDKVRPISKEWAEEKEIATIINSHGLSWEDSTQEILSLVAQENPLYKNIEPRLSKGWDLADAQAEGWTAEYLIELEQILQQKGESLFIDYPEPETSLVEAGEDWDDLPPPTTSLLLPVEPFNKLLLPEPMQEFVTDIAYRMRCPMDFIAIPIISMFGSLIGTNCGIRPKQYDDWLEVPNLWGCIVGRPGSYKSPALKESLSPLKTLEKKAYEKYAKDIKEYDTKQEALKILAATQKNGEISDDLQIPTRPVCQRFQTNDVTVEKLTELLNQNPRGLLYFRDELMGFFATLDKQGNDVYRSFYLEAWGGTNAFTTDRISRGTIHCDKVCISILGGTQPSKLLPYLQKVIQNFENDGLLQRFQLLVYPDEVAWEYVDSPPNQAAQEEILALAEKIISMDFTQYGAQAEQTVSIPYFRFTPEAQSVVAEWLTELNTIKIKKEKHPAIAEHLSKYPKLMVALALNFHIIEIAAGKSTGQVTLQSAQRAMAWCDYLELHARRIYGMVLDSLPVPASVVLEKIKKGILKENFSLRDVYKPGWRSIGKNPKIAEEACNYLVGAGYLKVQTIESSSKRKVKVYRINPKIWN